MLFFPDKFVFVYNNHFRNIFTLTFGERILVFDVWSFDITLYQASIAISQSSLNKIQQKKHIHTTNISPVDGKIIFSAKIGPWRKNMRANAYFQIVFFLTFLISWAKLLLLNVKHTVCHVSCIKWANWRIFIRFSVLCVWHKFYLNCKFDFIFWLRHNQFESGSAFATGNYSTDQTDEENKKKTVINRQQHSIAPYSELSFQRPDMGNLFTFFLYFLLFCSVYLLSFIVMAVCQFSIV